MKDDRYITLIYKSLKGEITKQELPELEMWLDASEENRQLRDRIAEEWTLANDYQPAIEVDVQTDFAKLRSRVQEAKAAASEPKVVKLQPRKRSWLSIAAGIAILVAGGLWLVTQMQEDIPMLTATTDAGEIKEITLPDGSVVTLNENSTLTYPVQFESDLRQVTLSGEGFFDIQRNKSAMFVTRTRWADVEVLGTSFNVDAYKDATRFEVTVNTGKVQLRPMRGEKFITLTKGQVGIFNSETKQLYNNWANPNTDRWRTGELSFEDQFLRDVLLEVEKEFKIIPVLERTELEGCKITARFEDSSADDVMKYLASTFEMKLEIRNEVEYHLLGGESCDKKVNYSAQ